MTKKCIIGVLFAYILTIGFNYLYCGLVGEAFAQVPELFRSEADMQSHLKFFYFGEFVLVLFAAIIFKYGYQGQGAIEGLRFGFLLGVVLGATKISAHAWVPHPDQLMYLCVIGSILKGVVIGGSLGLVYAFSKCCAHSCEAMPETAVKAPKKATKSTKKKK